MLGAAGCPALLSLRLLRVSLLGLILLTESLVLASPPNPVTPGSAAPETAAEEEERTRAASFLEVESGSSSPAEMAMTKYNEWLAKNTAFPFTTPYEKLGATDQGKVKQLMLDLYKTAGSGKAAFQTVALLLDKGLPNPSAEFKAKKYSAEKIKGDLNVLMAQAREKWIEDIILKVGKDKWKIARSDSGNIKSGVKSDVDQTFYVYEHSPDGSEWVRNPDLDKVFIDSFEAEWGKTHELTLDMLDVASHQGKNRFPDPRAVEIDDYSSVYRGAIENLRNTKGAYTTYGAVLQQMQLRALAAIEEGNPRAFQQYGPSDGKTSGEWKKWGKFDRDEALRTMFGEGRNPQLMHGLAFGAAMANLMELQHYMHEEKFETKYHLRTWDDALYIESLVAKGIGAEGKKEYTKLSADEKMKFQKEFLQKLFPRVDEADSRKLQALALDASANLRDAHKEDYDAIDKRTGKNLSKTSTDAEKKAAIFGPLANVLSLEYDPNASTPEAKARNEQLILDAEQQHRLLAEEFCLRAVYHTSTDAFRLMLDAQGAIDLAKAKHLFSDKVLKTWGNLNEGTKLTLLYAFYDQGTVEGRHLLNHMIEQHPGHSFELYKLYLRGQVQGFEGHMRNPEVYLRIYGKNLSGLMGSLNERVQRHVLNEFGVKNVDKARMIGHILDTQNLTWNWRHMAREKVLDKNNLDALGNVLRKYFETKGDMTETMKVVGDEIFLAIPVVGQLESMRRGDVTAWIIIGLTMYSPTFGTMKLAYSVGEHAVAIHNALVVAPIEDNLIDAIYRGFGGPETKVYGEAGKAPPSWTEADQKELDSWHEKLSEARKIQVGAVSVTGAPLTELMPDNAEWQIARQQEYQRRAANIMPHITQLEEKLKAYNDMQDGAWTGNSFGGYAQLNQKFIPIYLLKDIPPMTAFFSKGVVDLNVAYDPAKDGSRLTALAAQKNNEQELMARLKASREHQELELRKTRYDQGLKYKEYLEQEKDKSREMLYRFQRDSLFKAFLEKYQNTTDAFLDQWVDDWIKTNQVQLVKDLIAQGLLPADTAIPSPPATKDNSTLPGPTQNTDRTAVPPSNPLPPQISVEKLKARLKADMARSRQFYLAYEQEEKNRQAAGDLQLAKAETKYRMASLGMLVDAWGSQKPLSDTEQEAIRVGMQEAMPAMRYLAIPRQRAKLEATVYRVAAPDEVAGSDPAKAQKRAIDVSVSTKLTVDPTLYFPDSEGKYATGKHILNKEQAESAASQAGGNKPVSIGEVTLLPESCQAIKRIVSQHKEQLAGNEGVIVVVSALAYGMPDLSEAPPETIADIPVVKMGDKYLMVQRVAFAEVPAKAATMEAWFELGDDFPVNYAHFYEHKGVFKPIIKMRHFTDGTMSGTCEWEATEVAGVPEKLEIKVNGKIDEATGRVDLNLTAHHERDWGDGGSLEEYTGNLAGWRTNDGMGNSAIFGQRGLKPGTVTSTHTYMPKTDLTKLYSDPEQRARFSKPTIQEKEVSTWGLKLAGNRGWPSPGGKKQDKPMKGNWTSSLGTMVLDQWGNFVEGSLKNGDKIGRVRADYSTPSTKGGDYKLYLYWYLGSRDDGHAELTSKDGKSWSGDNWDRIAGGTKIGTITMSGGG
jgi:hypothetical protein